MKQIWQATDGTIFDKEIDCEKYEDLVDCTKALDLVLEEYKREQETYSLKGVIELMVYNGHASKLINFIKSIGEQDGN